MDRSSFSKKMLKITKKLALSATEPNAKRSPISALYTAPVVFHSRHSASLNVSFMQHEITRA
jgi:hypothetical protein